MSKEFKCFAVNGKLSKRMFTETSIEPSFIYKSQFEKDRDRILNCKAFRRLSGKTQVFTVGKNDHTRTRLTHTLEVAHISTLLTRYFGFNDILAEAIALGHDLGHTPFGHVGERTLNYIMNGCYSIKDYNLSMDEKQKGFKHNWQSIRRVIEHEQINKHHYGLNLTNFTLWGILNHSNLKYRKCNQNEPCNLFIAGPDKCHNNKEFSLSYYEKYFSNDEFDFRNAWSFEGIIVSVADEIAQRHHDIEDGIITQLIEKKQLIEKIKEIFSKDLGKKEEDILDIIDSENEDRFYIPQISRFIVDFLLKKLIEGTETALRELKNEYKIKDKQSFERCKERIIDDKGEEKIKLLINYDKEFIKKEKDFQVFLKNRILNSYLAQSMDGQASFVIRSLFKVYLTNPQQLPDASIIKLYRSYMEYLGKDERMKISNMLNSTDKIGLLRNRLENDHAQRSNNDYKNVLLRCICDFISGMTDQYALEQYKLSYANL